MNKEQIIKNLAADSTGLVNNTDFFKHLNEGDFAANMATMIARVMRGKFSEEVFRQLAQDELDIELDSYIDEIDSGRREI